MAQKLNFYMLTYTLQDPANKCWIFWCNKDSDILQVVNSFILHDIDKEYSHYSLIQFENRKEAEKAIATYKNINRCCWVLPPLEKQESKNV